MLSAPDLAGRKILVTGGSGFLGNHLLPALLAVGASVSCLVRSEAAAHKLPRGVAIKMGDCGDSRAVADAVQGQDTVIHLAGLLFGVVWQDYITANAVFARNIAQACKKSGVGRVIFVSSLAAAGPCASSPGRAAADPAQPVSAYGWSKLVAEQIQRSELGEKLAILRPPVIYGSGDRALLPLFKSCKRGIGIIPAAEFPFSMIHAADAARAIVLCAKSDLAKIWHLSDGRPHSMRELCLAIAKNFGRDRILTPRLPGWILASAALAGSGANALKAVVGSKKQGRSLAWNWDKWREARQVGWLADSGSIADDLGFVPQYDLERGMAETVAGYRRDGWL